jgi:hypothetical protein
MGLLHTTSDGLPKTMTQNYETHVIDKTLTAAEVLRAADFAASCLRGALP